MAILVLAGIAPAMLGGCETANLFGGSGTETTQVAAKAEPAKPRVQLAVAPVMGAPDTVAAQLADKIVEEIGRQNVKVVKGTDPAAEHVLRGYVVASKAPGGAKVSYIWDITDKSGSTRTHRVQGEETVRGKTGTDAWSALDAKSIASLASKAAPDIAKWVAAQPAPGGGPAVAQAPTQPATGQPKAVASAASVGAAQPAQQAQAPRIAAAPAAAPPPTTASIAPAGKTEAVAFVPTVAGAPGDGSSTLAAALQKELSSRNVNVASAPAAGAYKVQGRVAMGQPSGGKQSIQIEWTVLDPAGRKVGTVSQKNTVQQGSLDGPWGQTASAAAEAAAQGIVKLLPAKATN